MGGWPLLNPSCPPGGPCYPPWWPKGPCETPAVLTLHTLLTPCGLTGPLGLAILEYWLEAESEY